MDNLLDEIIRYYQGDLNHDEMIKLFQELVKNGMAWKLQGHYGRTASELIDNGLLYTNNETEDDE